MKFAFTGLPLKYGESAVHGCLLRRKPVRLLQLSNCYKTRNAEITQGLYPELNLVNCATIDD